MIQQATDPLRDSVVFRNQTFSVETGLGDRALVPK